MRSKKTKDSEIAKSSGRSLKFPTGTLEKVKGGQEAGDLRKFGIELVGDVPWGTHVCQFYETRDDLTDILVSYFKAGLENNEFCMWVTAEPLNEEEARKAMRKAVPNLSRYLKKGQIEIISYKDWYLKGGIFDSDRVLAGWVSKFEDALKKGYAGLRLTGNTFWLERNGWKAFTSYEEEVNNVIGKYKIIALCTYSLEKCNASEIIDVIKNHQFALIKRSGKWELIESSEHKKAASEILKEKRVSETVIESLPGIFYLFDSQGRFLRWNKNFERVSRYSGEEISRMHPLDFFVGTDKKLIEQVIQEVFAKGESTAEADFVSKDGTKTPYFLTGLVTTIDNVPCLVGTGADITERTKTENALYETKEKLEHLNKVLKSIRDVNQLIAREKKRDKLLSDICDELIENLGYYNVWISLCDVFGNFKLAVESGLGKDFLPLVKLLKSGELPDCARRALKRSEVVITEHPYIDCKDCPIASMYKNRGALTARLEHGGVVYGVITASTMKSIQYEEELSLFKELAGDIAFALHSIRLEEERKQAEEATLKAKQEWEQTFDSMSDLVAILDNKHRILRVNKSMAKRLGRQPDQCTGLNCFEYVHSLNSPLPFCPHSLTIVDGKEHTAEVHEDHLGGDFIVTTTPLFDKEWQIIGSIHVAKDITKRKKAEEALKETRDYLDNLLNYANAPIIVWDSHSKITMFNHAFERLTGLGSKDAIGKPLDVLFPRDRKKETLGYIQRTLVGERWETVEIPILHIDGTVKTVLWNSANICDASGKIVATIAQGQDITERKKAEEALRQTTDYLESLFNYANAPIICWDVNFKITRFNQAFERLTYHKAKDVIGKDLDILFPDESREESLVMIRRTLAGEQWQVVEIPILRKDGEIRLVLWNSANIYAKDGKTLLATIAQGQDITERKKIEAEREKLLDRIFQSEKKYRTLYETTLDGIVATDMKGHITECNDAFTNMLGYSKDELKNLTYQQLTPEKWHEMESEIVEQVSKKGYSDLYEKEYIRKDGTIFPISIRVWLVKDDNGEPIGMWGIVRDVTQMKQLENELKRYSLQLEQLVEERTRKLKNAERLATIGEVAGMVGHDIRNPLQSVEGAVYLIKEEMKSIPSQPEEMKTVKEMLKIIEEQTTYVDKIVSDLEDYAKPLIPQLEEIDCQKLIDEVLSIVSVPPNIELSTKIEKDCTNLIIDPAMMKRVITNLVVNAIQAMPSGGKLTIKVCKEKERIYISVQDTGVGIPEDNKPKLFQPLFSTKSKGQGFGLAVVKRMVEAHNGEITLESEVGRGTTFTIIIPVTKGIN